MRALLVALLAARTAAQCPSPYEGTSTDACFLISDFPATFSQCQQHCESNGGSLATIKDKAEDDYVRQLVTTQQAVWIGLFESGEQDESGVWEWVNGMSDTWRNWQPAVWNQPVRRVLEQASRQWRAGRRDDSARRRRELLISTQAARRAERVVHGRGLRVNGAGTLGRLGRRVVHSAQNQISRRSSAHGCTMTHPTH